MQSITAPDLNEINFNLTENQTLIIGMVRDFAEKHIRPHVMEWDEAQAFPIETFKELDPVLTSNIPPVYSEESDNCTTTDTLRCEIAPGPISICQL